MDSSPKCLLLSVLLALGIAATTAAAATAAAPVRVTVVGDSVAAALDTIPLARARLARGLVLQLDLRVCRRLVQQSCPFRGVRPPTALEAVRSFGRRLGDVLVVAVGYNEGPQGYGRGIDRVMRAALGEGVSGVVWVTLREKSDPYRETNAAIRAAARRWPQLLVADWNRHSAGRQWFARDGLHLSTAGADALAGFLRPFVLRAARD